VFLPTITHHQAISNLSH